MELKVCSLITSPLFYFTSFVVVQGGIKTVRIPLLLAVYTFTDEVWRRHRNRIMTKSLQQTGHFFISARLLFFKQKSADVGIITPAFQAWRRSLMCFSCMVYIFPAFSKISPVILQHVCRRKPCTQMIRLISVVLGSSWSEIPAMLRCSSDRIESSFLVDGMGSTALKPKVTLSK